MPIQAHTRRDPQKGKKEFSTNKGFTLIELMIGVGIMAVIMSLALPSYRSIIEKRQVTSAAEQLTAFLSTMKGEAVKLNQDLAFSFSTADKCMGFQQTLAVCDCSAANNTCKVGNVDGDSDSMTDRAFRASDLKYPGVLSSMSYNGTGNFLVYDSVRGMLDTDAANAADGLTVALESSGSQYELNVEIDRLGRVKVCSPQSNTAVPGYPSC